MKNIFTLLFLVISMSACGSGVGSITALDVSEDQMDPVTPPIVDEPEDEVQGIADLAGLGTWLSSSSLELIDGDAVGTQNSWPNQGRSSHALTSVGGEGTYFRDPLGLGFSSVFLCGYQYAALPCHGSINNRGTQLRMAGNFTNYSLILGEDADLESDTGGGSFTVIAVVARASASETPISYHRDGNAAPNLGLYLGWRTNNTFRFSTQGRSGQNAVEVEVAEFVEPELLRIAAVFSRVEGMKLFLDGELKVHDPSRTLGVNVQNIVIPTLGFRQGNANYGLHLFDWIEFDRALASEELLIIDKELVAKYQFE